jgi:hypothetical protein
MIKKKFKARASRMIENLRTHGRDPHYRKSALGSWWSLLLVLIVIPWLLMQGCVDGHKIPLGDAPASVPRMIKVQRKQERKLLDSQLAESAFNLGVNVVYYAARNYLQETRKYRKGKQ